MSITDDLPAAAGQTPVIVSRRLILDRYLGKETGDDESFENIAEDGEPELAGAGAGT